VGDKLPPALSAGTNGITDGHSWWQCLFQTGWGIDNLLKMSGRWWSGGGGWRRRAEAKGGYMTWWWFASSSLWEVDILGFNAPERRW